MPYDLRWRDQIKLSLFLFRTETMDEFCETVFPSVELQNSAQNDTFFCDRAILTFRNNVIANLNQKVLDKLPGELYIYDSIDTMEDNVEEEQYLPWNFCVPLYLPIYPLLLFV